MERLYWALAWLAGIALVVGLVNAYLHVAPLSQQIGQIGYGSTGVIGSFGDWAASLGIPLLSDIALTLAAGVTLLGLALARAERRWVWLVVVLVFFLASLVWPTGITAWVIFHPAPAPLPGSPPAGLSLTDTLSVFSVYATPLVAVLLVLVMALTRRGAAPGGAGLAIAPVAQ